MVRLMAERPDAPCREEVRQMPNVKLYCPFGQRLSADFHGEVIAECKRCRTGEGECLAELVFRAADGLSHDLPAADRYLYH